MNYQNNGGVWKAYASRAYDVANPRIDNYIEVNIPEYMPTVPQDNEYTNIAVRTGYFVNTNYPNTTATIKSTHYIKLPLLAGTTCPIYLEQGAPFLLFTPTEKPEEGYLLYIGTKEGS